jgi:PBSX family phage terminase large subunit
MIKWIRYSAFAPKGHLPMIGKTERTLEVNILEEMGDLLGDAFTYSMGSHKGYIFDREVLFYGANDKKAVGKIQGMTAAGAYGDEITLWPIEFFKMLLSRMSIDDAQLFGTMNPDAPMHPMKKEFLDRQDELDLAAFHFVLDDNPGLSKAYKDALKKEYVGLWFKRFILGLWVLAEGAVYDFFTDSWPYVIKTTPEAKFHVAGIDYGTQNPFCCLLFGVNPNTRPKIWAEKEYWYCGREQQSQKTDQEYAKDIKLFFGGIKPRRIYIDPSATSFKVQCKREKIYGLRDANNEVLPGIRTQARMLKSGEYAIHERCKHTREEYGAYVWDEKAQIRGEDKPKKEHDHSKDSERYPLHTMYGEGHIDYSTFSKM